MIEKTLSLSQMNSLKKGGQIMLLVDCKVKDEKVLCINHSGSDTIMADVKEYRTSPSGLLYAIVENSDATV